jgi:hypothetical protein
MVTMSTHSVLPTEARDNRAPVIFGLRRKGFRLPGLRCRIHARTPGPELIARRTDIETLLAHLKLAAALDERDEIELQQQPPPRHDKQEQRLRVGLLEFGVMGGHDQFGALTSRSDVLDRVMA